MPDKPLLRIGVILAVRDVAACAAFYEQVLNFDVDAVYDAPAYATLTRGSMRL